MHVFTFMTVMVAGTGTITLLPALHVALQHDDDCYQISRSLAAIGTARNSVERKLLITSTTRCPFTAL
jgi:DNA-binding FrmR family transcriptional regulator